LKRTVSNYWIIPVLIIAGFYSGLRQRKYKQLVLVLAIALAYFIAMTLTFNDFAPFYTESELMPLSIIVAAPFVFYTLSTVNSKFALIIIGAIFLIRLVSIFQAREKFVERKDWIFSTLKRMKENKMTKAFIDINEISRPYYLSDWSTPQESIIASALSGDKPNLSFIVGDLNDIRTRLPSTPQQLLGSYEFWDLQSLNQKYFSFDTTSNYRQLSKQ